MSSLIYHTSLIRVINHCIESTFLLSSSSFFILNLSLSLTNWSTTTTTVSVNKIIIYSNPNSQKTSHSLTSINLVISCTFSLFLSLKASRASLYSFSWKHTSKTRFQCCHFPYINGFSEIHSTEFTFFWQAWPSGFNSLFTESIFFRTSATSFLIGSARASSSWYPTN